MRKLIFEKSGNEGQGLVEYALIIVLLVVACVTALGVFGAGVNGLYTTIVGSF